MKDKRLFHCRLWGRTVSLWRVKDRRFVCPRYSRGVVTCGYTIVTVTGKSALAHGGA